MGAVAVVHDTARDILYVSPSKLDLYATCGRKYKAVYVDRWSEECRSHALAFGSAYDDTCTGFLLADHAGAMYNVVEAFDERWDAELAAHAIAFSSQWDADSLRETGRILVQRFTEAWRENGFQLALDRAGQPIIQRDLEVELPNRVVLRTKLDFLIVTREGRIALPDNKTSATVYDENWIHLSEQLTDYQIAVDAHVADMGHDQVDEVGFIVGVKAKVPKTSRGKGPYVQVPRFVPRRSSQQIAERLQKIQWLAQDIRAGRFPKCPASMYNTPCGMCFLAEHCVNGSMEGIVLPTRH